MPFHTGAGAPRGRETGEPPSKRVVCSGEAVFRAVNGVIDGPFAEMPVSTALTFGDSRLISGRHYVAVMLPSGERGYVFVDTKVLKIKCAAHAKVPGQGRAAQRPRNFSGSSSISRLP
jgi:hypothetical protein